MQSSIHVKEKVVIVTGAAKGIGAACASTLALNGASVIVADIDEVQGQEVVSEIKERGGNAEYGSLDVTNESDWQRMVKDVVARFGRLDVLVNNAGIMISNKLLDTSLEEWRRVHEVNLESVFLGTKCAVDVMRPGGMSGAGGAIINLSSVGGIIGSPGLSAYSSSKGAIRIFTKAIAVECGQEGYNIRVNSVHPGATLTAGFKKGLEEMLDKGAVGSVDEAMQFFMGMQVLPEIGQPEDIASMVLFLASDAAKFTTGAEFVVDGGLTAK